MPPYALCSNPLRGYALHDRVNGRWIEFLEVIVIRRGLSLEAGRFTQVQFEPQVYECGHSKVAMSSGLRFILIGLIAEVIDTAPEPPTNMRGSSEFLPEFTSLEAVRLNPAGVGWRGPNASTWEQVGEIQASKSLGAQNNPGRGCQCLLIEL